MDTTFEVCPHCDLEVEIDDSCPSKCPECGEVISPCSNCPNWDSEEDFRCDWQEESGCWRFPVIIPT